VSKIVKQPSGATGETRDADKENEAGIMCSLKNREACEMCSS